MNKINLSFHGLHQALLYFGWHFFLRFLSSSVPAQSKIHLGIEVVTISIDPATHPYELDFAYLQWCHLNDSCWYPLVNLKKLKPSPKNGKVGQTKLKKIGLKQSRILTKRERVFLPKISCWYIWVDPKNVFEPDTHPKYSPEMTIDAKNGPN